MKKVNFTRAKDGTKEEYDFLSTHEIEHRKSTAKRSLNALAILDESLSG